MIKLMACMPGLPERIEIIASAIGAGAMAGRERRYFIQKKEFGIGTGSHNRVLKILECKHATNPCFVLPAPGQQRFGTGVVNNATVTHAGATR